MVIVILMEAVVVTLVQNIHTLEADVSTERKRVVSIQSFHKQL